MREKILRKHDIRSKRSKNEEETKSRDAVTAKFMIGMTLLVVANLEGRSTR